MACLSHGRTRRYDTNQQRCSRDRLLSHFAKAKLNPKASSIKGLICGYRVEDIENPLTQKARYMDKLVDELARGKKMENVLRS
jgi:hypothetical protein